MKERPSVWRFLARAALAMSGALLLLLAWLEVGAVADGGLEGFIVVLLTYGLVVGVLAGPLLYLGLLVWRRAARPGGH